VAQLLAARDQRGHVTAARRACGGDVALEAQKLEVQRLALEGGARSAAPRRPHRQTGDQLGQLGVLRIDARRRVAEVLAQVACRPARQLAAERRLGVEVAQRLCPFGGHRDALGQERALGPRDRVERRGRSTRLPRSPASRAAVADARAVGAARARVRTRTGARGGGRGGASRRPSARRPRTGARQPRRDERGRQIGPVGHGRHELLAQRARRHRREHRSQRIDDTVLALGGRQVPGVELALHAEADEGHRRLHQPRHRLRAVGLHEVGGIGARRERHHAQLEPPARRHASGPQHRLLTRPVGVQRELHARREPRQLADLLLGQRRAHQTDGVAQPGLVHRDHVRVALGDDHAPRARRVGTGDVRPEQVAALVVDGVVGRVQVLRPLVGAQGPRAEAEHASAQVAQREHDPPAEAVVQHALALGALGEARLVDLAVGEAAAADGVEQRVVGAGRVAHAELAQGRLLEAPAGQVLARGRRLGRVPQVAHVERRGALEQLVQALARLAALGRRGVLLDDLQAHAVAVGDVLHRALEVESLGELHEAERVTALAAPEAVEELLRRVDPERRRALVVERAEPLVAVGASAA
jgi:hypothetical protein